MIVVKFGGTSVADGAAICRAAAIVGERRDRRPVVVLSALAGVTDELIALAEQAAGGDLDGALARVDGLRTRHAETLAVVAPDPATREAAETRLTGLLHELCHTLDALALLEAGGPRGTDAVIAHGELLSTTVFAAALSACGVAAEWTDARSFIRTDGRFGRARPDFPAITERAPAVLAPLLDAGRVPVTQGFIGTTTQGITTTIGRGGSDLTAALIAAALAAEEVQIWTDVHGIMTADPRVVPGARPLAEASYDEAAELAYFGAKVLHPATMVPVIDSRIPLRILHAGAPAGPGTLVTATPRGPAGGVRSIASKRRVTTVLLKAPRMLGAHGFLRRMFEVFDRHQVGVDVVSTSEVSVSLSIETGAVTEPIVDELRALGDVRVRENRAIICVVGEGLRETPGVAARIFKALGPVNVEMISQGASRINVTLVVQDAVAADVVTRLHAEFFPD